MANADQMATSDPHFAESSPSSPRPPVITGHNFRLVGSGERRQYWPRVVMQLDHCKRCYLVADRTLRFQDGRPDQLWKGITDKGKLGTTFGSWLNRDNLIHEQAGVLENISRFCYHNFQLCAENNPKSCKPLSSGYMYEYDVKHGKVRSTLPTSPINLLKGVEDTSTQSICTPLISLSLESARRSCD